MKSQLNATQIITSNSHSGDGVLIGAEALCPHHSTSAMTTTTPAASNNSESAWSIQDTVLVGASFGISLMLGAFAAQVVMDSPLVSSSHRQPIVVAIR